MKKEYLATCVPGLERAVETLLRREPRLTLVHIGAGAVTVKAETVPNFTYLQHIFTVLYTMTGLPNLDAAVNRLLLVGEWLDRMPYETVTGKSFRIVTMDGDRLVPVNMERLSLLEKVVSAHTGLSPNRDRPDVELWLWRRPGGQTVFAWRLQTHRPKKAEGALRDDLCAILAAQAKPGGRRALCLNAHHNEGLLKALKAAGAKQVTGLCPDETTAQKLRGHVPGVRLEVGDGHLLPLSDASQEAVVMRLEGQGETTAESALHDTLDEIQRVLLPGGRLVLMAPWGAPDYALSGQSGLDAVDRFAFTQAGKKCVLWVLERIPEEMLSE